MEDNKLWLYVVIMIATSIVTLSSIVNYEQNCHYRDMAKAGYEQTTIPGYSGFVWQKAKKG